VDLGTLHGRGVELTGRLIGASGQQVGFAGDLGDTVTAADARMRRVLAQIDGHIECSGLSTEVLAAEHQPVIEVGPYPERLDLRRRGITTVLWATGHRRAYPWLHVPVVDAAGEIRQRRGRTAVPGLYVVGQRFQHYRNSHFIDGAGRDAAAVAEHLARRVCSMSRA
jgi:putative flavoprotein involved in K+ transport